MVNYNQTWQLQAPLFSLHNLPLLILIYKYKGFQLNEIIFLDNLSEKNAPHWICREVSNNFSLQVHFMWLLFSALVQWLQRMAPPPSIPFSLASVYSRVLLHFSMQLTLLVCSNMPTAQILSMCYMKKMNDYNSFYLLYCLLTTLPHTAFIYYVLDCDLLPDVLVTIVLDRTHHNTDWRNATQYMHSVVQWMRWFLKIYIPQTAT